MGDEYDDIEELLQRINSYEAPSLLGDADTATTTHPLNINARLVEPAPSRSQVLQDRPRRPQQAPLSSLANSASQVIQDIEQSMKLDTPSDEAENVVDSTETYQGFQNLTAWSPLDFGFNEPIGYSQEPSNRIAHLQRGPPQSQGLQNLSTVPPPNFGINEPSSGAYLASNQFNISSFDPGSSSYYAELQTGVSQSQELHTPSSVETENVLASSETYQGFQNLFTVPSLIFGINEPSSGSSVAADPLSTTIQPNSAYVASNQFNISSLDPGAFYYTEPQSEDSQSQELRTPSGEADPLLPSTETENLFTLPPVNFGFNEPSGSSSSAAGSSQQLFSSNQFNIGSFYSYYTEPGVLSSSANQQQADSSSYHHGRVVAPFLQHPLMILRKQMREDAKTRYHQKKKRRVFGEGHRYESISQAALKKKRLRGRFAKGNYDDPAADDPADDDPPAQQ